MKYIGLGPHGDHNPSLGGAGIIRSRALPQHLAPYWLAKQYKRKRRPDEANGSTAISRAGTESANPRGVYAWNRAVEEFDTFALQSPVGSPERYKWRAANIFSGGLGKLP